MTIVSMIAFQAKINEVAELEDGLKQYVSCAKQVGSTMALIRATTGPMGLFWTLTLYETRGEMASTREKIVASNAGTAFQNALTHVSAPPNFSLWRQLRAVETTSNAAIGRDEFLAGITQAELVDHPLFGGDDEGLGVRITTDCIQHPRR